MIVFFARLFYPHIGGVEKHVFELSKILLKKGHKVIVFTEQYDSALKFKENVEGIDVYRISVGKDNWFKKFRIWRQLWKYRQLIKDADLAHVHDVFFWYLPFRFLYFKKPVFITFHGYESYPISKKAILQQKIAEKLSFGNICIGEFIKKWYGTKPNFVMYGGVREVKNEKLKVKNEKSALFIGRLDEQTGIKTYVNAVKLIRKKIPNFKFEIIGDGKFRKQIQKSFKVLGFQKNPEKYFSKSHFAFVSRYLSMLEAMVARRLVFAVYDNPIKEDYLRLAPFSKFITISNSSSEFVSKISFYLNNPQEKEKLIENAYDWVKHHTWEEMTNIYLKLWKKGFLQK